MGIMLSEYALDICADFNEAFFSVCVRIVFSVLATHSRLIAYGLKSVFMINVSVHRCSTLCHTSSSLL